MNNKQSDQHTTSSLHAQKKNSFDIGRWAALKSESHSNHGIDIKFLWFHLLNVIKYYIL